MILDFHVDIVKNNYSYHLLHVYNLLDTLLVVSYLILTMKLYRRDSRGGYLSTMIEYFVFSYH